MAANLTQILNSKPTNSILSLKLVTTDKVVKLLTELNSQKATGLDGLPAKFLKDGASTRGAKLGKIQGGCRFDKGGVTKFF